MIQHSSEGAAVAVVCRTAFYTGIGAVGFAACEVLARSFPVSVIPTDGYVGDRITLPTGRVLPICRDPQAVTASFFCDVLWNGAGDHKYFLAPAGSLKYALLVYDSDQLPPRWTELLNEHFDLVVAASPHLVGVARASGVESPIASLPIPLFLEPLLASNLPPRDRRQVRFGSVAAFHRRKGVLTLVETFRKHYGNRSDVELVLHSNLAFGDTYAAVMALAEGIGNIKVSHGPLPDDEKNRLIASFDVFVNCSQGEGYSIGAREALALGKSLVLSDVGGHKDLAGRPGVILIPAEVAVPARYPEIDNGVFGQQFAVRGERVAEALEAALAFARSAAYDRTLPQRRAGARDFSFGGLTTAFAALFNPDVRGFRRQPPPPSVSLPDDFVAKVERRLGRRADRLPAVRHLVCAAHDGGFFSLFNAFVSHLVWGLAEDRCHAVYPDWDVGRLLARFADQRIVSFCYGQPADGNVWLKLFEPLFGTSDAEMNDPAFLYRHAGQPRQVHNEGREPLMTYVHAYRLYRTRDFESWRRQYHRVFSRHVRLRPALAAEIDGFVRAFAHRRLMIAAHVRHPSHTIEQPNGAIAHTEAYVERIHAAVRQRRLDPEGPDWGVFLATDQERVVDRFRAEFGDRLACYDDVRRTRSAEDAAFEALSAEEKHQEGHQLQHLVAADRANWSVRMAWEVVRDAYTMARCHMMLHVVSNVSTAVAYMNPELEMVFCEAT